ncbi:MAG: hypothetical protein JOY96_10540 [Verrucomicrobia bacterium]|nr:hypothetical protein [Verrucomicrobiota bacterium]MBV9672181.1 hypothetical protein [Verrucomicrobiota bacterium]
MRAWVIILFLASRSVAQVPLPDLYIYNYDISVRDPFISADAPTTMITNNQIERGIVSGDVVQQYLQRLVRAIRNELYVGGISIGDQPGDSVALINGVNFRTGSKIPLDVSQKDLDQIQHLAASYGLPFFTDGSGALLLEVGKISEKGVDLLLPGFRAPIYRLILPTDSASGAIRLEKRQRKAH